MKRYQRFTNPIQRLVSRHPNPLSASSLPTNFSLRLVTTDHKGEEQGRNHPLQSPPSKLGDGNSTLASEWVANKHRSKHADRFHGGNFRRRATFDAHKKQQPLPLNSQQSQSPPRPTAVSNMDNKSSDVELPDISSVRAFHYDYAIRVAIREQNWKEAAVLYWEQISDAGNPPVEISIVDPVGLYAIARYTQQVGGAVADEVMDAVNQMTMISPMNQEKYVLAAGTALGYANAWSSCLNFLRTSMNSTQLGEPLVSATMHACILGNQHEQALKAFDERYGTSGSITGHAEWQVAGGAFRLSPLCRDLAMRASFGTQNPTACARAVRYFKEAQLENVSVSLEAVVAVARACETALGWEDSVELLFALLDHSLDNNWIVSGYELAISQPGPPSETGQDLTTAWWFSGLAPVLASTLRSCNAAGHFATALLGVKLFELAYLPQLHSEQTASMNNDGDFDPSIFRVLAEMNHDDDLLAAIMTALCGLGYYNRAANLFIRSRNARGLDASSDTVVRFTRNYDPRSAECFLFALSRSTTAADATSLGLVWKQIHPYTAAIRALELVGGVVPENQEVALANELADLMRTCTSAGFPDVSVCLARRTERLKLSGEKRSAFSGMVMSFLGVTNASFGDYLLTHDATLAEYIKSYSLEGWHDAAFDLFKSNINVDRDVLSQWVLSCNAAIEALTMTDRSSEAIRIFRRLGASSNAETVDLVAKALVRNEQWRQVNDLYVLARQNRLVSNELALLAMEAMVRASNQLPLDELRLIVTDTAGYGAIPDELWLRANYWHLKRSLGIETVRHLMGWNESKNVLVGELSLALETFDDRSLIPGYESDCLWSIVSNSKALIQQVDAHDEAPTQYVGRLLGDKQEWINLILRVAGEAKDSGLLSNGYFLVEVVQVLQALGANAEMSELVNFVLSSGWKLDQETLGNIRQATKELGENSVSYSDLDLLSVTAAQ